MKVANALLVVLFAIFLAACMSASQGPTPTEKTIIDDSDNTIKVIQEPVSAADSTEEGEGMLGFKWESTAPDIVILDVGSRDQWYISAVHFDCDGNIIRCDSSEGELPGYGNWGWAIFLMPLEEFRTIANARVVKMKVYTSLGRHKVTSFGKAKGNAIVDGKFAPFLEQVDTQLKKLKK